jgi:hypothetical protein
MRQVGSELQRESPRVSIIVPAHNAAVTLPLCLGALAQSTFRPHEVLVVCDGCADETAAIARRLGARAIEYDGQHGPSYARNVGADAARGDVFFFIDSDCVALPNTVATGVETLLGGEQIIFGSYTRETRIPGFLSKFKNLQHHYTHQQGADYQPTFWSGCGAATREAFEETGGFDVCLPSCEDIEYGWAANQHGYQVRLVREMQVEHLKRYNLSLLIRSDLLQRAAPWTQLIRSGRASMGALNTDWRGRGSVMATGVAIVSVFAGLIWTPALLVAASALGVLLVANAGLLGLIRRELGPTGAVAAVGSLVMHYSICGVGYIIGHLLPKLPCCRTRATRCSWAENASAGTYSVAAAKTSS